MRHPLFFLLCGCEDPYSLIQGHKNFFGCGNQATNMPKTWLHLPWDIAWKSNCFLVSNQFSLIVLSSFRELCLAHSIYYSLSYSLALVHLIPSGLVLAEIEFTGHVLYCSAQKAIKPSKSVQQSRQHVITAYCPDVYILWHSRCLLQSQLEKTKKKTAK